MESFPTCELQSYHVSLNAFGGGYATTVEMAVLNAVGYMGEKNPFCRREREPFLRLTKQTSLTELSFSYAFDLKTGKHSAVP